MQSKRTPKWRIERKRRKTRLVIGLVLLVLVLGVVLVLKCDVIFNFFFRPDTERTGGEAPEASFGEVDGLARKEGVYNILVVGCDREAMLTDVMMIVSFDSVNSKVAIAQLPRDTYIRYEELCPETSHKNVRANSLFSRGYRFPNEGQDPDTAGIYELMDGIQQAFGITLDRYVFMDLDGFVKIVDLIGGVELNVPADLDYDDPEQNLSIHLKAGLQRLDGEAAEGFVRFRHDFVQGDLGRVNAQKLFLSAFFDQAKSGIDIKSVQGLAEQIMTYMKTSMTVTDIVFFIRYGLEVEKADITAFTLPGEWADSYYRIYRDEALTLINRYLNVYQTDMTDEAFDPRVILAEDADSYYFNTNGTPVDIYSMDTVEKDVSIPMKQKD